MEDDPEGWNGTGIADKYHYIDHVRFSRQKIMEKSFLYYLSDEVSEKFLKKNIEVVIDNIPLVQVPAWSFNPHIGRSSVIKNFANMQISENPEKYICLKYREVSEQGKIYVYGKIGDGAIVKDLGRNRIRQKIRNIKKLLTCGKYAKYLGA